MLPCGWTLRVSVVTTFLALGLVHQSVLSTDLGATFDWASPCVSRQADCRMKSLFRILSTSRQLACQLSTPARRCVPQVVRHLRKNPHGHNTMGSFVVLFALGFLYFQAQPTTAGTDPTSPNSDELLADVKSMFAEEPASGETKPTDDSPAFVANDKPTLTGKDALKEVDRLLAETEVKLEKTSAYSAKFIKQERLGNSLTEVQVIQFRMFHNPKKISMKWEGGQDAGQRVVYVEGENGGDMLVRKQKGFEARLGVIPLAPAGSLALKHSRYPVTKAGLLELTKVIREQRALDLKHDSGITSKMLEHQQLDGHEVIVFSIEYDNSKLAPDDKHEYRKTLIYLDAATKFPVCVRTFGWPDKIHGANPEKLDQTTLLELYAYKDIDLAPRISQEEFLREKL